MPHACIMPQEMLRGLRARATAAAAASGIDKVGVVRRMAIMDFMGLGISLQARDTNEEINLRMACFLKAESTGKLHGLPPLFFEVGLLQPGVRQATCRISPEVLQDYRTARMAARDLIQTETVLTGDMLQTLLAARQALYLQIDGTFAIELAIVKALSGVAGEEAAQGHSEVPPLRGQAVLAATGVSRLGEARIIGVASDRDKVCTDQPGGCQGDAPEGGHGALA